MANDAWKAVIERLEKIDKRLNGIDRKLWGALTALALMLTAIIGWLLANGLPWN